MKALILDLRNNPGGLLTAAVEVSEKFIDDGKLVVYTEGRVRNQNMRFSAHAKKRLRADADGGAREQRQRFGLGDRGRRAPGLGPGDDRGHPDVRQGLGADHHPAVGRLRAPADHGEVLHPKGRSIHGKGITPDVVSRCRRRRRPPKERPLPSADPLEDLKKDVQLQKALEVVKTMRTADSRDPLAVRRREQRRSPGRSRRLTARTEAMPAGRRGARSHRLSYFRRPVP